MELNYAKEVEGIIVHPTDEEFRGIPNWRTHEAALRRRGYMPLAGTPEQRPGYVPVPKAWHKEERTETKIEPRQFYEDVYEEDPETHEMVKTGTRMVIRDTEVQLDKSFILVDEWDYEEIPVPPPEPVPVTIDDYNRALEDRLRETRCARGYTDREPSDYYNSGVERWAQDARDWIDFRDRVMSYGLAVLNEYQETGVAPLSLDEFRQALSDIECHWTFGAE